MLIKQQSPIGKIKSIRKATITFLPVGHSFIPFDIIISAYCGDESGKELTVKALFASLPYSAMGIRYHFKKLLHDGWLELHNGDQDTRVKRVRVTQKLLTQINLFNDELEDQL